MGKDSFFKLACSIDSLPKRGTYVPRAVLKEIEKYSNNVLGRLLRCVLGL